MTQSVFHGQTGGLDFLGIRKGRRGGVEIVYDDGVRRRQVWRVVGEFREKDLSRALARAARQVRVLPALYNELRQRSIAVEAVVA